MPRRISDETKQLIVDMKGQGLTYREIARRAGVDYTTAYGYSAGIDGGFVSPVEYYKRAAVRRGFASLSEYNRFTGSRRQERRENQVLSYVIEIGLEELGRSQSWLAGQIGVTRESISKYAQGKTMPNGEIIARLFSALELPYLTLGDLL